MNEVLETIMNRRSIRRYLTDQIKDEELNLILEAAKHAPSARNDQSWHFTVIQNKEIIDYLSNEAKKSMKLSDMDWIVNIGNSKRYHVFHHAPTVIIISGRNDATEPLIDCSAAVENMLLAAESMDIGSCWIGLARFLFTTANFGGDYEPTPERLQELKIPFSYKPFFAITLGYKDQEVRAPPRNQNVVSFLNNL